MNSISNKKQIKLMLTQKKLKMKMIKIQQKDLM